MLSYIYAMKIQSNSNAKCTSKKKLPKEVSQFC